MIFLYFVEVDCLDDAFDDGVELVRLVEIEQDEYAFINACLQRYHDRDFKA
jgi:hypothetical protein